MSAAFTALLGVLVGVKARTPTMARTELGKWRRERSEAARTMGIFSSKFTREELEVYGTLRHKVWRAERGWLLAALAHWAPRVHARPQRREDPRRALRALRAGEFTFSFGRFALRSAWKSLRNLEYSEAGREPWRGLVCPLAASPVGLATPTPLGGARVAAAAEWRGGQAVCGGAAAGRGGGRLEAGARRRPPAHEDLLQ